MRPTDVVMKYHNSEKARIITVTSCNFPRQFISYFLHIKFSSLFSVPVNEPNSSEVIEVNIG